MTEAITLTAKRTFWDTFARSVQLWVDNPYSYFGMLALIGIYAYLFYTPAHPWLAAVGSLAWGTTTLVVVFAMKAWRMMQVVRRRGPPAFTFDETGIACITGPFQISARWSGIHHVRMTAGSCFIYPTRRLVWFFRRDELTPDQWDTILGFARAANARVEGA